MELLPFEPGPEDVCKKTKKQTRGPRILALGLSDNTEMHFRSN